jgi:hypothetical protein
MTRVKNLEVKAIMVYTTVFRIYLFNNIEC